MQSKEAIQHEASMPTEPKPNGKAPFDVLAWMQAQVPIFEDRKAQEIAAATRAQGGIDTLMQSRDEHLSAARSFQGAIEMIKRTAQEAEKAAASE